ncbi:MAG: pyridoxine 5'-phosphate synthase [Bacteroidetes bacterium RBG_13_46_8]|nr:MAG: pyridoxine 5'-phosphate synthase [Bacteroidetes bacterium RBG_13_46_8]
MSKTRLSVNINKIATLRNARGGPVPDVVQAAVKCQEFGAQGITVHPRPDERHIRYQDVRDLSRVITTEFNIEGYPSGIFIDLVMDVRPHQVTLVPDSHDVITSNQGWNVIKYEAFLKPVIREFQQAGIRTSLFIETDATQIECAAAPGTNRIELYTEPYARNFTVDPAKAVTPYIKAAQKAIESGLELNAGHDLNLANLSYFRHHVPGLMEVSIGHALISDALYFGLEKTIGLYLEQLK